MRFSLKIKSHDTVIKLIIAIVLVVALIIGINFAIMMKIMEKSNKASIPTKAKVEKDFLNQWQGNTRKTDTFPLK